ncbi:hypothetical protein K8I61_19485 [bacterium]|nr:hypothetical protein [bacterium]
MREVARITGKNIVFDPRISGEIDLVATRPMTAPEIWRVAVSALDLNGYALIEHGAVVRVVPRSEAATHGGPVHAPPSPRAEPSDEIVAEVFELAHIDAARATQAVSALVGNEGRVVAAPGGKRIVVVDRQANVERVRRIIERVDRASGESAIVAVHLEHADAARVAAILTELFARSGSLAGGGCDCKFTHEPRSNSVIVRAHALETEAAKRLAESLDHTDAAVRIERLSNLSADEARNLLQSMAYGGGAAVAPNVSPAP